MYPAPKPDSYKDFAYVANPHSWLLTADNLFGQASLIRRQSGNSIIQLKNADGSILGMWDQTTKSVFLLGGFAIENMLKGFLVFENPNWVSNGRLHKPLLSHDLLKLEKTSQSVPYKGRSNRILKTFGGGLESWARYPCGTTLNGTRSEPGLSEELWQKYHKLMRSYARRLRYKLQQGWIGPHGVSAQFDFSPLFLAIEEAWQPQSHRRSS